MPSAAISPPAIEPNSRNVPGSSSRSMRATKSSQSIRPAIATMAPSGRMWAERNRRTSSGTSRSTSALTPSDGMPHGEG